MKSKLFLKIFITVPIVIVLVAMVIYGITYSESSRQDVSLTSHIITANSVFKLLNDNKIEQIKMNKMSSGWFGEKIGQRITIFLKDGTKRYSDGGLAVRKVLKKYGKKCSSLSFEENKTDYMEGYYIYKIKMKKNICFESVKNSNDSFQEQKSKYEFQDVVFEQKDFKYVSELLNQGKVKSVNLHKSSYSQLKILWMTYVDVVLKNGDSFSSRGMRGQVLLTIKNCLKDGCSDLKIKPDSLEKELLENNFFIY